MYHQRIRALQRTRYRINSLFIEDRLKSYSQSYRMAQDVAFLREIEALQWAIDQATRAIGEEIEEKMDEQAAAE